MRLLFDNNVPTYLTRLFSGHQVRTAYQESWHELSNGNLIAAAAANGFELLVTLDRGFITQQNIASETLGVAVLVPVNQRRESMTACAIQLLGNMEAVRPGIVLLIAQR